MLMEEVVHIATQLKTCLLIKEGQVVQPATLPTVWIVRTILTVFSVMKEITFIQRMVSVCTVTTALMNLLKKEAVSHVRLWVAWTVRT